MGFNSPSGCAAFTSMRTGKGSVSAAWDDVEIHAQIQTGMKPRRRRKVNMRPVSEKRLRCATAQAGQGECYATNFFKPARCTLEESVVGLRPSRAAAPSEP